MFNTNNISNLEDLLRRESDVPVQVLTVFYTVYTQDTNTTSIFHNNLIVKIIILHTKSCFGKLLVHNTDPVTARMAVCMCTHVHTRVHACVRVCTSNDEGVC